MEVSVTVLCMQTIHKELEQKIAAFHGRDDAILYAACFDANAGHKITHYAN